MRTLLPSASAKQPMLLKVPEVGKTVGLTGVVVGIDIDVGFEVVVVGGAVFGSPLQPLALHVWPDGHALQSWPTEH